MNVVPFKRKSAQPDAHIHSSSLIVPPAGSKAIGIDLGTTHSVVSLFSSKNNKPRTLMYDGSYLVPSLVYYNAGKDEVIVGSPAKVYLETQAHEVIKSTKREMGRKNSTYTSNGKAFSSEDCATHILNYMASHPDLEDERKKNQGLWAVITVPAHFDDAARTATVLAAQNAGIHVLRIINEPTAAALAYSLISEEQNGDTVENPEAIHENLAVFDFGGGTFDVSVVERRGLTFNVMSSEGDVNLGGDDVDEILADILLKKVEPPFTARRTSKESILYRNLLEQATKAKKQLQESSTIVVHHDDLDGFGATIHTELERQEFDLHVTPLIERTLIHTENAMHAAKKSPKNISRILLVGGSTRLNLVRSLLANYFPCLVDARLEPDLAVSWGASLQAAIILGIEVDTILVDVCSHSLGIGVVESSEAAQQNFKKVLEKFGLRNPVSEDALEKHLGFRVEEFNLEVQKTLRVAHILHRNSALPAKKSEFFNTVFPNQAAVQVVVVQGEGDVVGDNRLIGSFMFHLQQPCPLGTRCEIQLTYDINGMIQVFAKQLGTSNESRAIFDSRTGEVKGWSQINEQQTKQQSKKSIEQETDNSVAQILQFPVMRSQTSSIHAEIPIVNGVINRAQSILNKLSHGSPEHELLSANLEKYIVLLRDAKQGQENDDLIDYQEEILIELMDSYGELV